MPRSWSRLHEYLGLPPGPLRFKMVEDAVAGGLEESDDLDWKGQLPERPRDGRFCEFAKDVAAMANTRGGLLVYGVSDDLQLHGIDPTKTNEQQLRKWIHNFIRPYLADIAFVPLDNGASHVLVVDVPTSEMAPHSVLGTAAKDKEQFASVVPYRHGSHTEWMEEHQIARAYRDRFIHQENLRNTLEGDLTFTEDRIADTRRSDAWLVAVARPIRPLPHLAPSLALSEFGSLLDRALRLSDGWHGTSLHAMRTVVGPASSRRRALRGWMASSFDPEANRYYKKPGLVEARNDGSLVLAVNLSRKFDGELITKMVNDQPIGDTLIVDVGVTEVAVTDFLALAMSMAQTRRIDGPMPIMVNIVAPATSQRRFRPIQRDAHDQWRTLPNTHTVAHFRRVESELPPYADDETSKGLAAEIAAGLINQFGLDISILPQPE